MLADRLQGERCSRRTVTALAVINGVAIVVLVFVTGYYAWQAREMAREMRQARLLSLLPKLVLDVEMVGPAYGNIVVHNVGVGPALDADLAIVFEPGDEGIVEERRWLAHVVPAGERHEFLLPEGISDMTGLVARHRSVALRGEIRDALGQHYKVDERMDIGEWWDRLGEALHRWEMEPADRIAREFEKSRKELESIHGRLSVLASVAERWWKARNGDTGDR